MWSRAKRLSYLILASESSAGTICRVSGHMDDAIDADIIMQMLGQITQRGRGGYSCFREGGSRSEGAKSEERVMASEIRSTRHAGSPPSGDY